MSTTTLGRSVASALSVLGLALVTTQARSDLPEGEPSHAHRYFVPSQRGTIQMGGASILIHAPATEVHRLVTDYGHYDKVVPGFARVRVLSATPRTADVYLQAPILHGAMNLWATVHFVSSTDGKTVEGHKLDQGNVEALDAVWRIEPVDDTHTTLKLELLLLPQIPVPSSLLSSQLAESADDAVTACRDRLEATTH